MRIRRVNATDHPALTPCAAVIGNFDGVHLGHQTLLQNVVAEAAARDVCSRLISFDPLPHEFFSSQGPARVANLRGRVEALKKAGIDELVLIRFDATLAAMTPARFAADLLCKALGVQHLTVGQDFRFGARRAGGIDDLRTALGADAVTVPGDYLVDEQRVSSTWVRRLLAQGAVGQVQSLLGRPYAMSGRVVHGDEIGRKLGFPTANINHRLPSFALRGVYAAWAMVDGERHAAVVNIGTRPTVSGVQARVEAHLLDGEHALYGKCMKLEFVAWVRDEQRFAGLDALTAAINADALRARELLAATRSA